MPPLVQNLKLLLICTRHGCNPCIKFGIDQVKGSKDIEQTTHWARKSGLTLTFDYMTWKSIGIMYLWGETPAPSLVLIKWKGLKILSGQRSGLKRVPVVWPLNMCPENHFGSSTHKEQPLHQVWYWSSEGVKRYWADTSWFTDQFHVKHSQSFSKFQMIHHLPIYTK